MRFNTYLRGLLGLLDAKVGGLAPQEFEDTVRGTLDLLPFFQAQRAVVLLGGTGAAGAEGFWPDVTGNLVVPADEIWLVEHFCVQTSAKLALAGDVVQFQPAYQQRSTALGLLTTIILGQPMASATNDVWPTNIATGPFLLRPGDTAGLWIASWAGAAQDNLLSMVASKLKI